MKETRNKGAPIHPNFGSNLIGEERKTSYNRTSNMGRMLNEHMKWPKVPNTADDSTRKRTNIIRRVPYSYSQSRPK